MGTRWQFDLQPPQACTIIASDNSLLPFSVDATYSHPFSMQWLRKVDHYKPLKPLAQYKPIYDAYFGPLNHYWFGALLLAQGILLIMSSLTLNLVPIFSLLLLLIIATLLLCYLNHVKAFSHTHRKFIFAEHTLLCSLLEIHTSERVHVRVDR